MIAAKPSRKIAAWSSYWSEGNVTSLPNLFTDNYSGDLFSWTLTTRWGGVEQAATASAAVKCD